MSPGNPNYPRRRPLPGFRSTTNARWGRQPQSFSGGVLASLPIVVTVGVNSITDTSANVIGSINPNGADTLWWIAYDTQLPLSPGTATTAADAGSGSTTITVTFNLTGLVPGGTYYVAVVGQNAGGTVYGQTVSFQAVTPPTTTTTTVAPVGQPTVNIPHFQFPFTLVGAASGVPTGAGVVEQDTVEEIVSNVGVIMFCPVGACPQLPNFGSPVETFSQEPINTTGIETAIQQWEPRATEDIVSQLMPDGQSWSLTLMTSMIADQNT